MEKGQIVNLILWAAQMNFMCYDAVYFISYILKARYNHFYIYSNQRSQVVTQLTLAVTIYNRKKHSHESKVGTDSAYCLLP